MSLQPIVQFIGLSPNCTQSLFVDFKFEPDCIKLLVSKMLGYLIILGAMFFKIPQILAIIRNKSVEGLSLSMFVLELVGYFITLAYNLREKNPFSTYGETFFVILQNISILFLFFYYKKQIGPIFFAISAGFAAAAFALFSEGIVPMETLILLQAATIPIFTASKLPQIIKNFRESSAGNLAFMTYFMQFGGSTARVFTTISEVNDSVILAGFLLGFALNGVLVLQIFYYNLLGFGKSKKISSTTTSASQKRKTKKVD